MSDTTTNPTKLVQPARLLDAESPICESAEDCSVALAEIGWIEARSAAIDGQLTAEVARLKQAAEARKIVRGVRFSDRIALLRAAVIAFAVAARAVLLPGDKKTAKLTHGEIKFRDSAERLEVEDAELMQIVIDEIQTRLAKWLARQKVGDVPAAAFVSAKVTFDRTLATKSQQAGALDAAALKSIGLKRMKPPESVSVNPAAYTVTEGATP